MGAAGRSRPFLLAFAMSPTTGTTLSEIACCYLTRLIAGNRSTQNNKVARNQCPTGSVGPQPCIIFHKRWKAQLYTQPTLKLWVELGHPSPCCWAGEMTCHGRHAALRVVESCNFPRTRVADSSHHPNFARALKLL